MLRFEYDDDYEEQDQNHERVESTLANLKFPAERREIVRFAQERHAPEETILQLTHLPERTYRNLADVIMQMDDTRGRDRPF